MTSSNSLQAPLESEQLHDARVARQHGISRIITAMNAVDQRSLRHEISDVDWRTQMSALHDALRALIGDCPACDGWGQHHHEMVVNSDGATLGERFAWCPTCGGTGERPATMAEVASGTHDLGVALRQLDALLGGA